MTLRGNLKDMSLANLIQLNCKEMRSARLVVMNADQNGEIYLSDGQVVHASLDTVNGQEALYEMFSWENGKFILDNDIHADEKTIATPWNELLIDGMIQAAGRSAKRSRRVIPTPAQPTTLPQAKPSPLYLELEEETWRLVRVAQANQVRFVIMDPVALWMRCKETRRLVSPPQKRQIDFAAPADQSPLVVPMLQRVGYQANYEFNLTRAKRWLIFNDPVRAISVNVFLDAFEAYHRLDLRAILAGGEPILPATAIVLTRLQVIEISDANLADLCALVIESELEKSQIDTAQIAQLCAGDWGWYKTVTRNIECLSSYAEKNLAAASQEIILRWVYHLRTCIEVKPKTLRWLTRAGLGESVRWYEVPDKDTIE